MEDKLDFEDYQLIKNEGKKKIDTLETERQEQQLSRKNSHIKNKLEKVLDVLPNLYNIYTKGDDNTKKN